MKTYIVSVHFTHNLYYNIMHTSY